MAVAEALAPGASVVSSSSTGAQSATNKLSAAAAKDITPSAPPPAVSSPAKAVESQPSASVATQNSQPSQPTSTTESTTAIAPKPLQPQPATVAPAAISPNPAPPSNEPNAPPPYDSLFGIASISHDYVDSLPEVPHEILRSRFNTSLALRANSKKSSKTASTTPSTSLVQPDLYKLHVRAQLMGSQTFLGPGKRVHNALSSHEWEVGLEELKSIRVFERIEQLKADKKWSFRQPKKQRIGVVPKAHWDYLLEEMVSSSLTGPFPLGASLDIFLRVCALSDGSRPISGRKLGGKSSQLIASLARAERGIGPRQSTGPSYASALVRREASIRRIAR